jgi:HEPN domain-containing protein
MNRDVHFGITEQEKASVHRREDARVLLEQSRWRGSMYLAGYAVECLLKARLMRIYGCRHLRELDDELERRGLLRGGHTVFTHQLESLLRLTGSLVRLTQDRDARLALRIVNRWSSAWRYHVGRTTRDDAEQFLAAVDRILNWIRHNI